MDVLHCSLIYLDRPSGSGRALANVEEASAGRLALSPGSGRPAAVDDHGLPFEQTHEVRRLLALGHTHLQTTHSTSSFHICCAM